MSILGAGGLPALSLASSTAASQQRSAVAVDRDKADQDVQKLKSDEVRLSSGDLDDSIETDFSHGQVADRDSDGRLPWQRPEDAAPQEQSASDDNPSRRAPDAQNEKGAALDVDA